MPADTAMASPVPGHTAMASAMPSHEAMGNTAMGSHGMGAGAMMNQPVLASHVIVGGLLHPAMSAAAGIAFAVVLARPIPAGPRGLATPPRYVTAALAGRAAPVWVLLRRVCPP